MSVFQRLLLYSVGVWIFTVSSVKPQIITSNLTSNQPVCPGETISFTCVTRGSRTIEWTSQKYISRVIDGPGLQFNKFSQLNIPEKSKENTNTVASLVNKTDDGGIDVLVSKLRIVVLSTIPAASVTCVHGNGLTATARFQVLADPDMPQYLASDQHSDGCGHCTIHISWNVPTNINVTDVTKYMMQINGTNIKNETNTNNPKLILTSYPVHTCATYLVSVKAVDRCGRAGRSRNVTTLDPPSGRIPQRDCGDSVYITTQSTSDGVTGAGTRVKSDSKDPCVASVVICILLSILAAVLLAITVVLAVLLYIHKWRNKRMEPSQEGSNDSPPTLVDSETKD